jgi:hypothetical protein
MATSTERSRLWRANPMNRERDNAQKRRRSQFRSEVEDLIGERLRRPETSTEQFLQLGQVLVKWKGPKRYRHKTKYKPFPSCRKLSEVDTLVLELEAGQKEQSIKAADKGDNIR